MSTEALKRVICLALALPLSAGQPPASLDPVAISPDRYTALLENEHVRVVEYVLLPGQRDRWHTHPPKVSYVVTGGSLRITTDDGRSFVTDAKTGSASWTQAVGRHFAENVGDTPVRIVLVEPKAATTERPASIVGTWKVERYENRQADGTIVHPFGEHPRGYFVYDATNHLSVQIMRTPAMPSFPGMRDGAGEAARYKEAFLSYVAYFGTYSVDARRQTVTHHVEGSLWPDYTDTDQVRPFHIESDRLTIELDLPGGVRGRRELVRVK